MQTPCAKSLPERRNKANDDDLFARLGDRRQVPRSPTPFQQCGADKLRAVVGSDITRCAMQADESLQYLNHSGAAD